MCCKEQRHTEQPTTDSTTRATALMSVYVCERVRETALRSVSMCERVRVCCERDNRCGEEEEERGKGRSGGKRRNSKNLPELFSLALQELAQG